MREESGDSTLRDFIPIFLLRSKVELTVGATVLERGICHVYKKMILFKRNSFLSFLLYNFILLQILCARGSNKSALDLYVTYMWKVMNSYVTCLKAFSLCHVLCRCWVTHDYWESRHLFSSWTFYYFIYTCESCILCKLSLTKVTERTRYFV